MSEVLQQQDPATATADGVVDVVPAREPLELAVLDLDDRLLGTVGAAADVDLAGMGGIGVELPGSVDLPGEHQPVRRVPYQYPAPVALAAVDAVAGLDPAMATLAHEGTKRYEEVFDLVYRRQATAPNDLWQADHTELDLWVIDPSGKPARPWLTVIEDDHSRAAAGYAVSLEAPSAINTALALCQAIWRKPDPGWPICGIPSIFYTDHGSDFTSRHLETAAAELKIQLVFSLPGKPRGRGKIERLFNSVNQKCLQALPGYAPRGTPDRAGQARLTLPELDAAIGRFLTNDYHHRLHSETHQTPAQRWTEQCLKPVDEQD